MAFRRSEYLVGTTAEWAASARILPQGQLAVELAAGIDLMKVGDGVSLWSALPYIADADLASIAALTPTDGQILSWSTSLGAWTVVNPVGAGRIAAAVNVTNVVTSISAAGGVGTTVVIPSTAISVTNSQGRPVVIRYGATFAQTTVGLGSIFLYLTETTSGNVDKSTHVTPLPNSTAAPQASVTLGAYEFDIGAVTTTRTFAVRAALWSPAANNPAGNIHNSPLNPSWARADAA